MTSEASVQAQIQPALTLAELQALVAIIAPQDAGRLSPVLALVPLYAIRSGLGIEAVWASPAGECIDSMLRAVGAILTVEKQQAAARACAQIVNALDPKRMRELMMAA